jgi:hypothetical protein
VQRGVNRKHTLLIAVCAPSSTTVIGSAVNRPGCTLTTHVVHPLQGSDSLQHIRVHLSHRSSLRAGVG